MDDRDVSYDDIIKANSECISDLKNLIAELIRSNNRSSFASYILLFVFLFVGFLIYILSIN